MFCNLQRFASHFPTFAHLWVSVEVGNSPESNPTFPTFVYTQVGKWDGGFLPTCGKLRGKTKP